MSLIKSSEYCELNKKKKDPLILNFEKSGSFNYKNRNIYVKYFSKEKKRNYKYELKILKKIGRNNKHIIKYYRPNISAKNGYCLFLEFMEFELFDFILEMKTEDRNSDYYKSITLPKIAYQIILGLFYLHELNIIHNDIKSQNILINTLDFRDKINIKIIDFDLSVILEENKDVINNTHPLQYAGSPLYASPEKIKRTKITKKVDIFSFGLVIFESLKGGNLINKHPKKLGWNRYVELITKAKGDYLCRNNIHTFVLYRSLFVSSLAIPINERGNSEDIKKIIELYLKNNKLSNEN